MKYLTINLSGGYLIYNENKDNSCYFNLSQSTVDCMHNVYMQIHLVPDFSPIKKGNLILYGKHGRFVGGWGKKLPPSNHQQANKPSNIQDRAGS